MFRLIWFSSAGVALLVALYYYLELSGIGFPDGHRTELDLARIPLYRTAILASLSYGLISVTAVWTGLDRMAKWAAVLYVLALILLLSAELYLGSILEDGTGG